MIEHLGDDYLVALRKTVAALKNVPSHALSLGVGPQRLIDLEQAAVEIERYRKLGSWDLPQHEGWWLDGRGEVHHVDPSMLTGERSEWYYRGLGPWHEVKDVRRIQEDYGDDVQAATRRGREEVIIELRKLIEKVED